MRILEWEDLDFPARVALKAKSEKSFLNFTRLQFELQSGQRMMVNWHHRLMASKIDELIKGELRPRNLIVNIPPGGTKTEFFSIHLPAYVNMLVQTEKLRRFRNLNISFADTLVKRNSRRTRDLILSREYQEFWPCSFGVNQAEEWEIVDPRGRSIGQTVSRSSGGQITGGRGGYAGPDFSGFVCLDDYNKPDDMFSASRRDAANRLLVNTIRSRRGDKSKDHPTPFVSIQQRLHMKDATGFMLAGGMGIDFHHVAIPALVSEEFIDSLAEPWRSMCWKQVKNTESVVVNGVRYWSYWPENEYIGDLLKLWESDEYTFWSQYMQRPRALTGGLIDTAWFPRYETLPLLTHRAVYVDTNSGKVEDYNDYTAFTLVGVDKAKNLYIIDSVRGRWDPEDLLKKAVELWEKWKPHNPRQPAPLRHMAIEDIDDVINLDVLKNYLQVDGYNYIANVGTKRALTKREYGGLLGVLSDTCKRFYNNGVLGMGTYTDKEDGQDKTATFGFVIRSRPEDVLKLTSAQRKKRVFPPTDILVILARAGHIAEINVTVE